MLPLLSLSQFLIPSLQGKRSGVTVSAAPAAPEGDALVVASALGLSLLVVADSRGTATGFDMETGKSAGTYVLGRKRAHSTGNAEEGGGERERERGRARERERERIRQEREYIPKQNKEGKSQNKTKQNKTKSNKTT